MAKKNATTELTYRELPTTEEGALLFWADNAEQLATLMERLTPRQHEQSTYVNECGTAGCAMGWAAMSNEFAGLQYCQQVTRFGHRMYYEPVVNGRISDWTDAGQMFFGPEIEHGIFSRVNLGREAIIEELRRSAARMRDGRYLVEWGVEYIHTRALERLASHQKPTPEEIQVAKAAV